MIKMRRRRKARLELRAMRVSAPSGSSFMDNPLVERLTYHVGKIVVLMAMLIVFICFLEVVAIVLGALLLK
jgi:hypothetical protein